MAQYTLVLMGRNNYMYMQLAQLNQTDKIPYNAPMSQRQRL